MKIYSCSICHKVIAPESAIRLNKQLYNRKKYKQFTTEVNYDFCSDCYNKFERWINKHNGETK